MATTRAWRRCLTPCTRLLSTSTVMTRVTHPNIMMVRHLSAAATSPSPYEPFSPSVHGKPTWSLHSYGKTNTNSNDASVTTAELEKIASLSYINLNNASSSSASSGGNSKLASQVASVVSWCGHVRDINTDGVKPMLSPAETYPQLLRDDVVTDGGNAEGVLSNAAHTDRNYIVLPKTVDFSDT